MKHLDLGTALRAAALALIGLTIAAGASEAATLNEVAVSHDGSATRIELSLDGAVDFDHFMLADPARFVLDCIGVDEVAVTSMPPAEGAIRTLQADVWKGAGNHAVTRLMVDLAAPSVATVTKTETGLTVVLTPEGGDASWQMGADVGQDGTMETGTPAGDVSDRSSNGSEPESYSLTPAEEAFEYAGQVGMDYATNYERGNAPTVASFMQQDVGGLSARGGPTVSLDVQGADIYTVLRSISEYSGVNIVMGYDVRQEVSQPVSFHLQDVPWGDALEMVLRSAHLWYREENGIIRVDTEENLRDEELNRSTAARQLEDVLPLTTRIVNVVYANADELKLAVMKSLSGRGMIEVDDRSNSLVVTDIPNRVNALVEMIQHLDSQTPQVEIVAKLVEVDARVSRSLGAFWGITQFGGNSITGIDPVFDGVGQPQQGSVGSNQILDPAANLLFGVVEDWGQVSVALSALEQENKANIISNPRITTVNNRQARILVGQKIPLIVLDEAGNTVTQLTTIGITLEVNPHINDNNYITLDLHPEVSDLSSEATVQGGVIINTSEADTRVMVKNGETAVIGGLIRSNETTLERGVPVLKDIPLLGDLFFKGSQKVKAKRELLIFVTPRIVNSFASMDGE